MSLAQLFEYVDADKFFSVRNISVLFVTIFLVFYVPLRLNINPFALYGSGGLFRTLAVQPKLYLFLR